jgi:predicted transcriptional regulator
MRRKAENAEERKASKTLIAFECPNTLIAGIDAIAIREDRPRSSVIRKAIVQYLANMEAANIAA